MQSYPGNHTVRIQGKSRVLVLLLVHEQVHVAVIVHVRDAHQHIAVIGQLRHHEVRVPQYGADVLEPHGAPLLVLTHVVHVVHLREGESIANKAECTLYKGSGGVAGGTLAVYHSQTPVTDSSASSKVTTWFFHYNSNLMI